IAYYCGGLVDGQAEGAPEVVFLRTVAWRGVYEARVLRLTRVRRDDPVDPFPRHRRLIRNLRGEGMRVGEADQFLARRRLDDLMGRRPAEGRDCGDGRLHRPNEFRRI